MISTRPGVEVTSITSTQERETYRERLYREYLANHRGPDLLEARARLQGAYPYFKRLLRHFPENREARVLDLGCGYSVWLHWLKQAGYQRLEGVDRSPEQVEAAHSLGLDFVRQVDIQDHLAEREPESCDVVLAFDVLEHFGKEEALQFADQVFRALTPGGLLILHLPNGEGFLSGSITYGDFTHELIVNRHSLAQLLRCAGFSQVHTYEDTPVVQGPLSVARYLVWKATRVVLRLVYAAQTGSTDRGLILTQNFLAIAQK
jgi:2-polyprenyl-3-methyl-5-hydroxy-6-metoxy-1,4-benzoquinol methylase